MHLDTRLRVLLVLLIDCLHVNGDITSVAINKCCPQDQHFEDDIHFECVKRNASGTESNWYWLPQKHLINKNGIAPNLNTIIPSYGHRPSCIESSRALMYIDNSTTAFQLQVNKSEIVLKVLDTSTLHNISVDHRFQFPSRSYCVDVTEEEDVFYAVLCPCEIFPCVRKCCYDYQSFSETLECVEDKTGGEWRPRTSDGGNAVYDYYRLVNTEINCVNSNYSVRRDVIKQTSNVVLRGGGEVQALDENKKTFKADNFCVERMNGTDEDVVLYCIQIDTTTEAITIFYGVLVLISAFALLVTVALTLYFPDMRKNIHGKMALCHNAALLVAFTINGVMHLNPNPSKEICVGLSIIMQSAFLAAFFWLNAMCLEISWVFSVLRPVRANMDNSTKKFLYYSLYAWCSTIFIAICTLLVEFIPSEATLHIKPNFGIAKCFFDNRDSQLLFYYGPMAVLLIFNIGLFLFTAIKILMMKKQTAILQGSDSASTNRNKKELSYSFRLVLYLKLFTLMGSTWIFEVISWAVGGPLKYWVVTDVLNMLRGIFIFYIFCYKKSVIRLVTNQWRTMWGQEISSTGTSKQTSNDGSKTASTPNASSIQMVEKDSALTEKDTVELVDRGDSNIERSDIIAKVESSHDNEGIQGELQ